MNWPAHTIVLPSFAHKTVIWYDFNRFMHSKTILTDLNFESDICPRHLHYKTLHSKISTTAFYHCNESPIFNTLLKDFITLPRDREWNEMKNWIQAQNMQSCRINLSEITLLSRALNKRSLNFTRSKQTNALIDRAHKIGLPFDRWSLQIERSHFFFPHSKFMRNRLTSYIVTVITRVRIVCTHGERKAKTVPTQLQIG